MKKRRRVRVKRLKINYENVVGGMFAEFAQLELATAKKVLGITKDIVLTTNRDLWNEHFPAKPIINQGASVAVELGYMYIDPNYNSWLKTVKESIWHELLHIKHPSWNHIKLNKEIKKYIE